jgi:hypothetical protein
MHRLTARSYPGCRDHRATMTKPAAVSSTKGLGRTVVEARAAGARRVPARCARHISRLVGVAPGMVLDPDVAARRVFPRALIAVRSSRLREHC